MDEMLKYDYKSSKKGRSSTMLLIQRQPRKNKKQKRGDEENMVPVDQSIFNLGNNTAHDILKPPTGVMDVSRWYNQLTPMQQAAF